MFGSSCWSSFLKTRNDGAGERGADGDELFTMEICDYFTFCILKTLQINPDTKCGTARYAHHYITISPMLPINNIKTGFISMLSNHRTPEASRQTGRKLLVWVREAG